MASRMVADSEDEDYGDEFSPAPQDQDIAPTRVPDILPTSHASQVSTDQSFFQNVFDEQIEATRIKRKESPKCIVDEVRGKPHDERDSRAPENGVEPDCWAVPSSQEEHRQDFGLGRKKRRLNNTRSTRQNLDDSGFPPVVKLSSSDGAEPPQEPVSSNGLMSTIPVDETISLWPENSLSRAQKLQDESIQSSNDELSTLQTGISGFKSSGTTTNVNTSRSELNSPRDFISVASAEKSTKQKLKRITRSCQNNPGSSPDIICRAGQTGIDAANENDGGNLEEQSIEDILRRESSPGPTHQVHDDDSRQGEFAEQTEPNSNKTRTLKTRGRPKKPSTATSIASNADSSSGLTPKPENKKKRGRPKKSKNKNAGGDESAYSITATLQNDNTFSLAEHARSDDGELTPEANKSERTTGLDHQKMISKVAKSANVMSNQPSHEIDASDNADAEDEKCAVGASYAESRKQPESLMGFENPNDSNAPPPMSAKSKAVLNSKDGAKTAGGKETSLTSLLAKPLHRVGLSKRSRIAPLLKTLPK